MNILFLSQTRLLTDQTGDATQYRETVAGLKAKGHRVTTVFLSYQPIRFQDESLNELTQEAFQSIYREADVVHLLPCSRPVVSFVRAQKIKKPIVASPIFWAGWTRVFLAWCNRTSVKVGFKNALRYFLQMIKSHMDFRGIDVFLPNTWAEGACVRKHFKMNEDALCVPVSNGFRLPNFDCENLERPANVPKEDYLVVPGVFSPRKNQLALIRALRQTNIPIVFMGGLDFNSAYVSRCQKQATKNMHFIGYVPSASREYWAVLKHARAAVLASDCETPGIALLEAAAAGVRPIVTKYGGTMEYYGFDAEYLNPMCEKSIREAVLRGWTRGRLTENEAQQFQAFSWERCVDLTIQAYQFANGFM